MEESIESRSSFRVKFYGADHIDASTLSTSLSNIVGTIGDISKETNPNSSAKLEVVSTQKGCFEISLETIIKFLPTIFNKENITIASQIIMMFLNILMIKKFLKGEPPKEITKENNKTKILNNVGESILVDRATAKTYFNSPTIDNRTVNIFNVLKLDKNRDDLLIESIDGKNRLKISKTEFESLSKNIVEEIQASKDIYTHVVELPLLLKKPDLLGKSKWGFVFNKIIEADIKDTGWLQRVQKGEIKNLYAGVRIPVKMLIEVGLDDLKNPKGEPKYSILEVTGDIIEPPQNGKLFDI